ncbi:hypothetical protein [Pseudoduganella sp. R-34]|uniref:hypothetical protein n=1 Tax=unclassified Pseudoduganella TaxID=2637179 RepID=UPI003CEB482F
MMVQWKMNASRRLCKLLLVCLAGLAATACAELDGLAEGMARSEMEDARRVCGDYGFRPGTDAYAQCVGSEVNARKDREQQDWLDQQRRQDREWRHRHRH